MIRRREVGIESRDGAGGRGALTLLACATLLAVPLAPGALSTGSPTALLAVPAESLVILLVLATLMRPSMRTLAAALFAAAVVAAVVLASLDLAFRATIDRPFDLAEDGVALLDAYGVVQDTLGAVGAVSVLLLAGALVVGIGVVLAAAALRIARTARDEARDAGRRGRAMVAVVAGAWIVCSLVNAQIVPGTPVAASRTGEMLVASSARAVASVQEQQAFERALQSDPLATAPPAHLMSALAGTDVAIVFVESYGRVAVEPSAFTGGIARTLDEGAETLARHGYSAQSAFLSSPTFGGVSWLAHATLQSGLWVDSPRTHDWLLAQDRETLTGAFGAAGWQTMAVVPSNVRDWDAGESFYGFDTVLDSRSMGYRGPAFGYARVPDQYTLQVFHDQLAAEPRPVMAEIDLVSSHTPWTPLPRLVPWEKLGDGSVFAPQVGDGEAPVAAWTDPQRVRDLYADSVEYSLASIFSYLETFDQDDLVLVILGDHQPARIVSGPDAGPEVPVTIIAKDSAVLAAISSWSWEEGVHPSTAAPVWRMDEFRDRFVEAFSR
ncbi:sulfatase-like hydrolase/transferase [Microbacterium yannicii]|uniref:sulfatase-like hydrolase/transferase n=1 Tax=Microbacterium yannicii TaxID=671622 RepID=UPI000304E541|nr:sulfatase-like hydrolase/transferase [Microbacterium yannicii]